MWNERLAELEHRHDERRLDEALQTALSTPESWFDAIDVSTQWVFVWLERPITPDIRGVFDDGVRVGYRLVGLLCGDGTPSESTDPEELDRAAAQLFIASRDSYGEILTVLPPVLRELRDRAVLRLVDRWRALRPKDAVTQLCGASQAGVQSGLVVGLAELDRVSPADGEP